MDRKIKVLLFAATILVAAAAITFFSTRLNVLGNMSHRFNEAQTSSSDFSFTGSAGDRIKISLRTTVQGGTVDFILSDSAGTVVAELDRAKALETYVDLSYDDTYTLTAIYNGFIGKFSAKVSV